MKPTGRLVDRSSSNRLAYQPIGFGRRPFRILSRQAPKASIGSADLDVKDRRVGDLRIGDGATH
jgi:hypothetical protein